MARRDHYVPAHHLARFRIPGSPPDRRASTYVAFAPQDDWRQTSVESIGFERGLYLGTRAVGSNARNMDPAFMHPEGKGLSLLRALIDGTAPNHPDVKYIVGEYIASLAWRTPVGFNMALHALMNGDADAGIVRSGRPGFSQFDDDMLVALGGSAGDVAGKANTLHDMVLNQVADEIQSLALALIHKRWVIANIDPTQTLITSDQPVVWDHPPQERFFSFGSLWVLPETKIVFPIAPDIVLWAYLDPRTAGVTRLKGVMGGEIIRPSEVNTLMLRFAQRFVASPEAGFPGDEMLGDWRLNARSNTDAVYRLHRRGWPLGPKKYNEDVSNLKSPLG